MASSSALGCQSCGGDGAEAASRPRRSSWPGGGPDQAPLASLTARPSSRRQASTAWPAMWPQAPRSPCRQRSTAAALAASAPSTPRASQLSDIAGTAYSLRHARPSAVKPVWAALIISDQLLVLNVHCHGSKPVLTLRLNLRPPVEIRSSKAIPYQGRIGRCRDQMAPARSMLTASRTGPSGIRDGLKKSRLSVR
jgi:hypothetical protein